MRINYYLPVSRPHARWPDTVFPPKLYAIRCKITCFIFCDDFRRLVYLFGGSTCNPLKSYVLHWSRFRSMALQIQLCMEFTSTASFALLWDSHDTFSKAYHIGFSLPIRLILLHTISPARSSIFLSFVARYLYFLLFLGVCRVFTA